MPFAMTMPGMIFSARCSPFTPPLYRLHFILLDAAITADTPPRRRHLSPLITFAPSRLLMPMFSSRYALIPVRDAPLRAVTVTYCLILPFAYSFIFAAHAAFSRIMMAYAMPPDDAATDACQIFRQRGPATYAAALMRRYTRMLRHATLITRLRCRRVARVSPCWL